jgi:hypothetical protein
VNPWGVKLFGTMKTVDPQTPTQQAAYAKWADQTSDRELARNERIHGADGVIPLPLWLALIVLSLVIFGYMLLFADSAEGPVTQGVLMGSVTVMITTSMLLLLVFFDNTYGGGVGHLQPTSMDRTLRLINNGLAIAHLSLKPPCDGVGNAT